LFGVFQLLKILNWLAALRTLLVFNIKLLLDTLSAKLAATRGLISLRHQKVTLLTPVLVKKRTIIVNRKIVIQQRKHIILQVGGWRIHLQQLNQMQFH